MESSAAAGGLPAPGFGPRSARLIGPVLAALAFIVAFAQHPGRALSDTRIELSADPGLFLTRVPELWSSTTDLGHVQAGQFVGYLFPMGPYFAAMDAIGVPIWIAQRVWLGALLAIAALGVVKLMETLYSSSRGWAHLTAGALFIANPFVVIYTGRATVVFLAYAALPWLMVAAGRGVGEPRRWMWPAMVGLLMAATAGGVNAAVLFYVLLAPAALLAYMVFATGTPARDALAFAWRSAVCGLVGALWWVIPVLLASSYGADFLSFTEQPEAILSNNSAAESLRLMGFWLSYLGAGSGGYEPILPGTEALLFSRASILASFLIPAAALGSIAWTRRWTFAPFFGILATACVALMAFGFPEGTPASGVFNWVYYNVESLQVFRTAHKAGPVLALAIACLGGAGVALLAARLRSPGINLLGIRLPAWSFLVLAILPLLAARPLFTGGAIDSQVAYGSIPASWKAAVADTDRQGSGNARTLVLPGELFGWYRWGGTWDSVAPALSKRPLVVRQVSRYADPRSSLLLTAIDDRIQQGRLYPGQLRPLLSLMSVDQALVATDGKRLRNGSIDPARLHSLLTEEGTLALPGERYGRDSDFIPTAGRGGPEATLPELRRLELTQARGIVRLAPQAGASLVDGDGDGIAAMAAVGLLDPRRATFYAADLGPAGTARAIAAGASLTFTDSNRRRVRAGSELELNVGPTLGPDDPVADVWPTTDPFERIGNAHQTVAAYGAVAYLRSPSTPGLGLYPERRPYAALDGNLQTAWVADTRIKANRYLEIGFRQPFTGGHIELYPYWSRAGRTSKLAVSVNAGPGKSVSLTGGWNRIDLGEEPVTTLRLRVSQVAGALLAGQGGIREIRLPGTRVREALRLPTVLAGNSRDADLRSSQLNVVLERTTADFPRRAGSNSGDRQTIAPLEALDAEADIQRDVTLPASRSFGLSGWGSIAATAPDSSIDNLVGGIAGGRSFESSGRFEGVPGYRASSAFDGDRGTAWVGAVTPGRPTWISARLNGSSSASRLEFAPGPPEYRRPATVRVSDGAGEQLASVTPDGLARLRTPVSTDRLRIEIVSLAAPTEAQRRRNLKAVAIGEVRVPGVQSAGPRATGRFASRCGSIRARAGNERSDALLAGTVAELDAGKPLTLAACPEGAELEMRSGLNRVGIRGDGVTQPDEVALVSPAASPRPAAPVGHVTDAGSRDAAGRSGIELDVTRPAWLILGESYSRGWHASCETQSGEKVELGAPTPVDGFGNGWKVSPDCATASLSFGPQRLATAGYFASLIGCLGLLAIFLLGLRGRSRLQLAAPRFVDLEDRVAAPAGWGVTATLTAAAAAVGTLVFAVRIGAAVGLVTLVLARQGISARRFLIPGAVLLAAVPLAYLANPPTDLGGFNFDYASEQLAAHWLAALGVCLVFIGCLVDAVRLRRRLADGNGRRD